jgi:transcriptional antiterminator RfaH
LAAEILSFSQILGIMNDTSETMATSHHGTGYNQSAWFCVQTHPKHEHIAARFLNEAVGIEAFNPQLRIRRGTKRGLVWFTESVFPGYIFGRFNLQTQLDSVRYCCGVTRVVQFNSVYPSVPDCQLNELKDIFDQSDMQVLTPKLAAGDTVRILGGAFHDLLAVVQIVKPAKQRVLALLEFLGRMTSVELDIQNVAVEQNCLAASHPLCRV